MEKLTRPLRLHLLFAFVVFAGVHSASAQGVHGELHIEVRDPQGATLAAKAELVCEAIQFHEAFAVPSEGTYAVQNLDFGVYRLTLSAKGFAPRTERIEIRSEVPVHLSLSLALAPVSAEVQVSDAATLVDPYQTGTSYSVGKRAHR